MNSINDSDLSNDERTRAQNFQFERVRRAFIQGRLFLRRMLGQFVNRPPGELVFTSEGAGKPKLADDDLAFNLSHSGGEAVLAISGASPVGVDIETVSSKRDLMGLAKRYFSSAEYQILQRLGDNERVAAFYRCWTRKEAFIKAIGEGLAHPLDMFSVSLEASEPAALLEIRGDQAAACNWRVFDLEMDDLMAGAVIVPCSVTDVRRFTVRGI